MAVFYPPEPPPMIPGRGGEGHVYKMLRAGFPDDGWTFFFDVRFWKDGRCDEQRELDVVIVHRRYGVLLIEIKGGEYDFLPGRGWCKRFQGVWTEDRKYGGAYNQLNSAAHEFVRAACTALGWNPGRPPFRHGQGVLFPFCSLTRTDGRLPADADGEITGEQPECASGNALRAWVLKRMQRVADAFPSSGLAFEDKVNELVDRYLAPRVQSYTRLAALVSLNDQLEAVMTGEQRGYANLFATRSRLLVEGYAGTGKTFMAVLLAMRFAKPTATRPTPAVALICFNRNLARQIDREALPDGHPVTAVNFHELIDRVVASAGLTAPIRRTDAWYAQGCVALLAEAAATGRVARYDAILIDEGQDFQPAWVAAVESYLLAPGGRLLVFTDPLQDVNGVGGDCRRRFGAAEEIRTNLP